MIEEERSPALRRRAPASGHVLGYRGLAYVDAELEEFSMDARSAPERICQAHLADQLPNFEGQLGPAGTASRPPAPEGAGSVPTPTAQKAGHPTTSPPNAGLRPHDCPHTKNTRPEPIQKYKDKPIEP